MANMMTQWILSVILFVYLSQGVTSQALTSEADLNARCMDGNGRALDDVNRRHPDYCEKFLQCVGGKAITVNCWRGLKYNAATDQCDWATNVACTSALGEGAQSKCYYSQCRFFQGMCVEDISKNDGYFCRCLSGYSGQFCQYRDNGIKNIITARPTTGGSGTSSP